MVCFYLKNATNTLTSLGCLTCRKRKVRCKGGSPCQNCEKINVSCQSSFDKNIKISFAGAPTVREPEKTQSPVLGVEVKEAMTNQQQIEHSESTLVLPTFVTTADLFPTSQIALDPFDQFGLLFDSPPDLDALSLQGTWDFDFSLEPFASCSPNVSDASQAAVLEESVRMPSTQYRFVNSTADETFDGNSGLSISSISKNGLGTKAVRKRGQDEMANSQKKRQKATTIPRPSAEDVLRDAAAYNEDYLYFAHYDSSIRESFSLKENARWSYHTFVLDFIQ